MNNIFSCKYYRHIIAVYNNILVIYMVAVGFNFQWNLSFCHPCMVFSRPVVYQESFILHSEELLLFKVVLKKRVIMSASLKGDNFVLPQIHLLPFPLLLIQPCPEQNFVFVWRCSAFIFYTYMYILGHARESHLKLRSLWPWPSRSRSNKFIFRWAIAITWRPSSVVCP